MKSRKELTPKQQKMIAASAVAAFVLLIVLVCVFVGEPLLRFASKPERFRDWVEATGFPGQLAFMGMVILQVVAAVIPGEPFEVAAGYAFGAVEGTVLCLIASAVGSAIVFLLVRRFGVRLVEVFFPKKDIQSLGFLQFSRKRGVLYLAIFMLPGTPKDLLCYFAGLTDIKLSAMLLISSLGRLPAIVTSTVGGHALGTESYVFAIVVFAVTILVSCCGLVVYDRMVKRRKKDSK